MTSPPESRLPGTLPEGAGADDPPHRVYALYWDGNPAPAVYAEFADEDDGAILPVIVHNLRYYEMAMGRWGVNLVELLVLNELHELTHWAMTDEERERFEGKSRLYGRPDGDWLNPVLFDVIEWLPRDHPAVIEPSPPLWRRLGSSVLELLGARADADYSSDCKSSHTRSHDYVRSDE